MSLSTNLCLFIPAEVMLKRFDESFDWIDIIECQKAFETINHKCFRKTESYQIFKPKHEIVCIISLWVNIFFVYRKPTLKFWNNLFWDSFGFHSIDSYISHVCPWYAPSSEIYLTWKCWWFLPYLLTCRCDKYWWKTQWNYCNRFVDNKINIDFGNNNTNW